MAVDAEFYQLMCLKWKCADLQTCTTNILIKVEKLIKYYTAVAEKILINSFAPRSLTFDD